GAREARRRDRRERRNDRRLHQPAQHDAPAREPALRAQRLRAAHPPRTRRRAEARLRRRDHRRRLRDQKGRARMSVSFLIELTVLILAAFLGVEVISKVPTLLHTPLMSGTNAIHGIVIVGAIIVAGIAGADTLTGWVGFVAMILAAANVVGGFVVTDRMLEMFRKREPPKKDGG